MKSIGALSTMILSLIVPVLCPAQSETDFSVIRTVEVPAGSFVMGNEGPEAERDEAPAHMVTISHPFRMGVTEVTNAQYEMFDPSHRALRGKNGVSTEDDDAVVNVSWQDAVDFCAWLSEREGRNYRLPTEAEWEWACRAGTDTPYFTGDSLPSSMCRNQVVTRDYAPVSLRVGVTEPNAFGLYDMHGNVEEWCLDWYGPYTVDDQVDPVGPLKGEFRITRGGSHNTPVKYLRSTNRMAMIPEDRHSLTGFRIVQSDYPLPQQTETTETISNQYDRSDQNDVTTQVVDNNPFFIPPIPFVREPSNRDVPFYRHNHQPSVTWCDNGDLLAAWFSTDEENGREMVVLSSRLRAGQTEWDEPELFFKVPDRNMTGTSLFNDGQGTLYHINGVEAAGDWQNLIMILRTSTDNGYTWSAPRIIAPEHTKRHQVISGTLQLPGGTFIQACDAGPGGDDGTAVHISLDHGLTWTDTGTTIAGIHAGIVALNDGSLMALGRGMSIADKDGNMKMPMSVSHDMGKTWEYHASEFPPIDGGQRLVLMRLHEGPLLLVSFTDHPERTPENERGMEFNNTQDDDTFTGYGMFAALSYDDGKTWPIKRLMTDGVTRELDGGGWTGPFTMDATHAEPKGYLTGVQTPDNTIHILSSRLHYRFNLSWLEQSQNQ